MFRTQLEAESAKLDAFVEIVEDGKPDDEYVMIDEEGVQPPIMVFDPIFSDKMKDWVNYDTVMGLITGRSSKKDTLWLAIKLWLFWIEYDGDRDPLAAARSNERLTWELVRSVGMFLGARYKDLRAFGAPRGAKSWLNKLRHMEDYDLKRER